MTPRLNLETLGVPDVARAKAFHGRPGLVENTMSNAQVGFFDINGVVPALFGHDALAHDARLP
jgi:hypothetical protein